MSTTSAGTPDLATAARALLPATLLDLPLMRLRLAEPVHTRLRDAGLLTVADVLERAGDAEAGPSADDLTALQEALTRALTDGLRQFESVDTSDWPSLLAQLLGPLEQDDRRLFCSAIGVDGPARSRRALQQQVGTDKLDERCQSIRTALMQHSVGLMRRLAEEATAEFDAFDGVLLADHAAVGSVMEIAASACDDPELGLRLAAFCLPSLCHLHRGALYGVPPRRFRELTRVLPQLVPQHRLPLPVDAIVAQLAERGVQVPRGALLHALRTEVHTAIELDEQLGEMAVPDPRKPAARLAGLLEEIAQPTPLADLVFAYRERFRFASLSRVYQQLSGSGTFLRLGQELWSLRRWHEQDLEAVTDLAETIARRVCSAEDRIDVHEAVRVERPDADDRTSWLVLDRLAADPRVRLLGRGDACAGDHQQSSVMRRLQRAFRRAAGDVVEGLFVKNQPESQRRLIQRLLEHNRAFVRPEPDRIDVLTNYPFNAERMQRLLGIVHDHLQQRVGYAHADALKELVDAHDLGGKWLSPQLLADILRRNGPFEVLEPGIVALADLALPQSLRRSARQALRKSGRAVTIPELVRARPELAEFRPCLARLLLDDPLVQSPDGIYFVLG